jgi:transcriptional regulator with XRE-family HTH domain
VTFSNFRQLSKITESSFCTTFSDTSIISLISHGDVYSLAIRNNKGEDTYAPMDLFDWLDFIKMGKESGLTQQQISEQIGWSRSKVADYLRINDDVGNILDLMKLHQEGRPTKNVGLPTFDFNETWFRHSGIYDLSNSYQLKFFEKFKSDNFKWNKSKVQQETAKLYIHQEV